MSNFLIYVPILPNREPKTSAFRTVFVFRTFFSCSTVVSVAKANVLQTPTIAVFARNWSGADPNFAPFRWRIWLALSEFLCLLANQNVTFVTLFCTQLPFSAPCYPKPAFLLANHNWEIFSCILLVIIMIFCRTTVSARPEKTTRTHTEG